MPLKATYCTCGIHSGFHPIYMHVYKLEFVNYIFMHFIYFLLFGLMVVIVPAWNHATQVSRNFDNSSPPIAFHTITRQSEMANTSPAPYQCLATFMLLNSKQFHIFSWRHFSARSSFYIINWYGYPRGSHEKHLKQIVRYAIEYIHVKRRTRHKWR